MNRYQDVLSLIKTEATSFIQATETIKLSNTLGRILSEEVRAKENIPAFNNSAVDGFAVRSKDLNSGKNQLKITDRSIPGGAPIECLEPLAAIEIMTGAPIPQGNFDLLLKVEDTLRIDDLVEFDRASATSSFIRPMGGDFKKGDLVCAPGTRITPKALMALSAMGALEVQVVRKPRVWLVSTGNEIVEADQINLQPGEIRNCTAPYLVRELEKLGCDVYYQGIVQDRLDGNTVEYEKLVSAAADEGVDILISTGAVSIGVHDFVTETIKKMGAELLFHKVAIRPGKPILFAKFNQNRPMYFFGLPGNPVSSVVGLDFFIRPFLESYFRVAGRQVIRARLKDDLKKPEGLRCFFGARYFTDQNGIGWVEVLPGQSSFITHTLLAVNAWAILPEDASALKKDALLDVILFD